MKLVATIAVLALAVCAPAVARADTPTSEQEQESARLYALGETEFRAGEMTKAIDAFDAGYRLSPRPEFLFNLAQCYRALGKRAEAIRYLERFIDAAPQHAFRTQAEKTLDELRRAEAEERQTQKIVAPPPPPPPRPAPTHESSSHRAWWIAAVVVVAGGLTAGAIWFTADHGDDGLGRVALPPR